MAKVSKIGENTWKISEWGRFFRVSMYLLIGSERAVMIDTGYGNSDLKKIVSNLTNKPVAVLNTHGHLDHVNGNHFFNESWLAKEDYEVWKLHSDDEFLKSLKLKHGFPKATPQFIDFTSYELGGRTLEIIPSPGHTKGSISILDTFSKTIFVGDNITPLNTWLGTDDSTSVTVYRETLETLKRIFLESGATGFHAGHSFFRMKLSALEEYLSLCDLILEGKGKKPKWVDMGLNKGYMSRLRTSSLVWREL
ncbi:MAG: MBL fold metallo-hydrolase [Clostridiales bacterium]|jgi:glyoxylase-like metal-dependent hydrolase (beta-lactamase superfamily II)|nr:MBL fold metallo-hydrolase [Clostridiales bacterium]